MRKFAFTVMFLLAMLTIITSATWAVDVERDALVALYNNTDGENWTNHNGWGTVAHYCTWYGVNCLGDDHVSILQLIDNNLRGQIPSELSNLGQLELLYLNDNQLTGSIPSELGNINSLIILQLDSNMLIGSIPQALGNPPNFEGISLSSNQLSGVIPSELGYLTELAYLRLNDNQLAGPIPGSLINLVNLRALWLNNNNLICWQTEAAAQWAEGLNDYKGPLGSICPFLCLPIVMSSGG